MTYLGRAKREPASPEGPCGLLEGKLKFVPVLWPVSSNGPAL